MAHSKPSSQGFVAIARSFKRLQLQDPVMQCLVPRLSRTYATVTDLPVRSEASASSSTITRSIDDQPKSTTQPPSAARFKPDVLVTHYSWPSIEPVRYRGYRHDHLNVPLRRDILHRAIVWEGDATRQGTANTKHRTEVRGSSRKVRPQKGTGRARLSDIRSPSIRGGGVVHGPKARDFATELPSKVYDLAWRTALSYRYKRGELIVLDNYATLETGLGPRWLDNFFTAHDWGKGHGRSLMIAERPDFEVESDSQEGVEQRIEQREHLQQCMDEMPEHGELQYVEEVDVKDLLSCGRIIIENHALRSMLKGFNARENFLEARALKWRGIGSSPP